MTKALESAIRRARALAPCSLADQAEGALRTGDFGFALMTVGSERRLTMLRAIWAAIPRHQRPAILASALSSADALCTDLMFIVRAVRSVRAQGGLVVASEDDQAFFDALPQSITVYRGTTQAELDSAPFFGVSWTTERARAEWFATSHGRFRRLDSPPILLAQQIEKRDLAGAAAGRSECEVFIDCAVTAVAHRRGALQASNL